MLILFPTICAAIMAFGIGELAAARRRNSSTAALYPLVILGATVGFLFGYNVTGLFGPLQAILVPGPVGAVAGLIAWSVTGFRPIPTVQIEMIRRF